MTRDITGADSEHLLEEGWSTPLEAGVRGTIRGFIETLLEEELEAALGRGRYARLRNAAVEQEATARGLGNEEPAAATVPSTGYRHGRRERQVMGSFGTFEVAVPRARLDTADGGTTEWVNKTLPAYRRRTREVDALIAGAYHAPLRYLCDHDPALRLIGLAQLIAHHNVPPATRQSNDPLLIQLKTGQLRFDGTPHVIVRTRPDGIYPLGIPGIQVDRGTESFDQIEKYLRHAIEFVDGRHYERHWGFDNCVIPFLFTKELRKNRAIQFVRAERGACPYLLFRTVPDYGLLPHFPRPEHYDRRYHYQDGETRHPDNIHVFTNPWQRAGCPDFFLNTFDEIGGV
jgi:Transposase, Mutator family